MDYFLAAIDYQEFVGYMLEAKVGVLLGDFALPDPCALTVLPLSGIRECIFNKSLANVRLERRNIGW